METLALHERFEMETLEILNSKKLLDPLLFGGGTMLRLCHGLNRYSVDLDFYFFKEINNRKIHKQIIDCLSTQYQITDTAIKRFTLLYEFRNKVYPRRLKIEIRRQPKAFKYEENIAFSPHSTKQILLKSLTLEQMMENKIAAVLNRKEIRDGFDLEFLLRKGIKMDVSSSIKTSIKERITSFNKRDFTTTLSSLLSHTDRNYYTKNGFKFLREILGTLP